MCYFKFIFMLPLLLLLGLFTNVASANECSEFVSLYLDAPDGGTIEEVAITKSPEGAYGTINGNSDVQEIVLCAYYDGVRSTDKIIVSARTQHPQGDQCDYEFAVNT